MMTTSNSTRSLRIVLLVVIALGGAARAADGITVGGRVLVPGGAPLPEAEVQLVPLLDPLGEARALLAAEEPRAAARTLTDAAGRFRLTAPHAGLWTVRIAAPGFAPLATDLQPLIEPIELVDAELAVDTGMTVRATAGGAPVAGALVMLRADRSRLSMWGETWRVPLRHGVTDARGSIRLARGEGESTAVSVSAPGWVTGEARGVHGTAATVRLSAGAAETLEVRSAAGQPAADVMLAVGSRLQPLGKTDAAGRITASFARSEAVPITLQALDGRQLETRIQGTPEGQPPKPRPLVLPDRVSVVGRLIDADSRRPIAGGVIWDDGNPADGRVTDRAGGFVLEGAPASRMRIQAGAPGYLSGQGFPFQLGADGRPGPTLALEPASAIAGTVVDSDGTPIGGAEVEAAVNRPRGGMRIEIGRPAPPSRNLSDAEGKFRLGPLDPAKSYTVKVRSEGFAPAEQPISGLEPYATRGGVTVTMSRGQTVNGVVVDPSGNAIRDASIEIRPGAAGRGQMMQFMEAGAASTAFAGTTDAEGRFAVRGLPAGTFDLEAKRSGFAKRIVPAIEIQPDQPAVDVGEITLQPGETVQGRVTDRAGAPVEGVEVQVAEAGGGMMMMVMGDGPGPKQAEPDAITDPSGWFTVVDLAPGKKYSFRLGRPGYVGTSVGPLDVPRVEPIEAVLDPASDVIGTVTNGSGEPIAGAQVSMSRTRTVEMGNNVMKAIMMMSDDSDAQGRFVFEDQEPGTISLSAVASGYQEAKLDSVEVPKGRDLEGIELPLEAGAVVQGRVLAPDGRPAIGASVRLVGEGEEFMRVMDGTGSDGSGYYRLEGLAPGKVSVEATHDDYPRTVRDLDAGPGLNSLDLQFEGGHEVSGQVVDADGGPVPNAAVRLVLGGRFWGGGPETIAGADGAFVLPGVQDGSYRLWVDAAGFASSPGEEKVTVAGGPVQGLRVRLDPGGTIAGKITGLEPELFAEVGVRADGATFGGFGGGGDVDYEGNYRLRNLRPGTYAVIASLARSGKQARGTVTLEPGAQEVRLDLVFGTGLTLSGRAVQGELPITGATIFLEGVGIDHSGWNETDPDGKFVIEGLEPGTYSLSLRDFRTGLAYNQTIEIGSSREIVLDVPTASVRGQVVDTTDRQPLPAVSVTLTGEGGDDARRLPIHTATTDLEGKFELGNVPDGTFTLAANKKGYAAVTRAVAVQSQRASEELKLSMDPTEGLTIEALLPTGAAPTEVQVAVLDAVGGALISGTYSTGERGRVRLSSVPPGTWTLIVAAGGSATTTVRAQAPGATVPIALQPATALKVTVPELNDSGAVATVKVADASGTPFRSLGWTGRPESEFRMAGGQLEFGSLPPGSWSVTVAAADGRTWKGDAVTTAGTTAELHLE
jgi:protocatechuate 3,4-dioxygenase beta subunit